MSLQDQLQPGEEILYRAHVTRLTLAPLVALLAVVLAFAAFAWFGIQSAAATAVAGSWPLILGWCSPGGSSSCARTSSC